jgi:hypothetical protein
MFRPHCLVIFRLSVKCSYIAPHIISYYILQLYLYSFRPRKKPHTRKETHNTPTNAEPKMGHLHLHRQGNHVHHQPFQTRKHKNSIPYKRLHTKPPSKPQSHPRGSVRILRGLQTHMPWLQQGIHRPNWRELLNKIQRT